MKSPHDLHVSRRKFIGSATAAAAVGGLGVPLIGKETAKIASPSAETLVTALYKSLTDQQREKICIPFDDPLRQKIENNWHIVPQRIGKFFNKEQQAMTRDIFLGIHSDEYRDKVWEQFIGDNRSKGLTTPDEIFGSSSVGIFGKPGEDKFEFVLTGRHCTRRCDGNSTEGVSFGGPIFYGHASQGFNEKPDHPGNVYWFQAKRANEVYQMLDGKQQEQALKNKSRGERGRKTVELKGHAEGLEGARVGDMTADQKEGIKKVLADLLLPFRKLDRDEAMKQIEPQFDNLHLAFFKDEDVGNDGIWDNWQLEGPSMIWYFRGNPHVHTWVNIEKPKGDPFKAA